MVPLPVAPALVPVSAVPVPVVPVPVDAPLLDPEAVSLVPAAAPFVVVVVVVVVAEPPVSVADPAARYGSCAAPSFTPARHATNINKSMKTIAATTNA